MQVVIEYGKGDVNQFLALADEIEDAFPKLVVEGQEVCGLAQVLCALYCMSLCANQPLYP